MSPGKYTQAVQAYIDRHIEIYIYLLKFKVVWIQLDLFFMNLIGAAISGHWGVSAYWETVRDWGTSRDHDAAVRQAMVFSPVPGIGFHQSEHGRVSVVLRCMDRRQTESYI